MTLKSQPDRPMCAECGVNAARQNGVSKRGYKRWQKLCSSCSKSVYLVDKRGSHCETCGFEAVDQCQLCFVDEQTICQNCNAIRLKRNKSKGLTVDATVGVWDIKL